MSDLDKIHLSWEDCHRDTKELCAELKKLDMDFKGIVVITRGGLIPAGIISSELVITNIETFNIMSYSEKGKSGELVITKYPEKAFADKGKGWLVIDELVDSGKTAKVVKEYLPESFFAAVYTKTKEPQSGLDLYIKYYEKKNWLCFPWSVYNF